MSCWAFGGLCLMHRAMCVYCHPVMMCKTTRWVIHADWLPSCPAAEGPGLGNKLVSFNIHNWRKAISRSVKMGLKGLCRRWALSEKTGGREGRGEWQKEWSRDLGCSEARTSLREPTEQSHRQQALTTCLSSFSTWKNTCLQQCHSVISSHKKHFYQRKKFILSGKITGFRKSIIR